MNGALRILSSSLVVGFLATSTMMMLLQPTDSFMTVPSTTSSLSKTWNPKTSSDGISNENDKKSSLLVLSMGRKVIKQDNISILFETDNDDDDDDKDLDDDYSYNNGEKKVKSQAEEEDEENADRRRRSRWQNLHPAVKKRLIADGQAKAIRNKKKLEPKGDAKRRMYMFMKEAEKKAKLDSRIKRPISFKNRTLALTDLAPGMSNITGTVINVVKYGVYVDIGTECDGLLHVSQFSTTDFIDHSRQICSAGDVIENIIVKSVSPELGKLHLTLLPSEYVLKQQPKKGIFDKDTEAIDPDYEEEYKSRIQLNELQKDDELWGKINRVTNYGAFIEVGAVVDGFLHFMDHPQFAYNDPEQKVHPSEFIKKNERVRVWVSEINMEQTRIKLTAMRPQYLPGPRRELF